MISNKLLNEVLNIKLAKSGIFTDRDLISYEIRNPILKGNEITYFEELLGVKTENKINIYELAYKCKKWLSSASDGTVKTYMHKYCSSVKIDEHRYPFTAKSEVKAMFKACEWILNEK